MAGERFTPDAKIYFNNVELPTSFVNDQRLAANVPANMIAGEGSAQIKVQTPDGSKYSLPSNLIVQPPPRPNFTYIGMIARKRGDAAPRAAGGEHPDPGAGGAASRSGRVPALQPGRQDGQPAGDPAGDPDLHPAATAATSECEHEPKARRGRRR